MLFLLSPVLIPMVREALQFSFMVRPTSDLYVLSASLLLFSGAESLAYSLPVSTALTWRGINWRRSSDVYNQHRLYPAAVGRRLAGWRWRPPARFWVVTALLSVISDGAAPSLGNITETDLPTTISTTTPEWTPFVLLNRTVPFMRISRSVSRYALIVQLCVAVLAGLGLSRLLQRQRPATANLSFGVVLLLILGEFWVAPYPMTRPIRPPFTPNCVTCRRCGRCSICP